MLWFSFLLTKRSVFQFQSELDSVLGRPLFSSWLHPSFFSPASLPFAAAPRLGLRCSSSARTEVIRPEVQFNCHSVRSTPGAADGGSTFSRQHVHFCLDVFFLLLLFRFVVVVAVVVVLFLLIVLFFFCLLICLAWLHQAFLFLFSFCLFLFSV